MTNESRANHAAYLYISKGERICLVKVIFIHLECFAKFNKLFYMAYISFFSFFRLRTKSYSVTRCDQYCIVINWIYLTQT